MTNAQESRNVIMRSQGLTHCLGLGLSGMIKSLRPSSNTRYTP